ncbi:MAG TPA: hypothetical protein DCZ03_08475 [Gammaproteobacteria bacterium]|nr:hypothetical protein [Gammaproteobacteria bacterium]
MIYVNKIANGWYKILVFPVALTMLKPLSTDTSCPQRSGEMSTSPTLKTHEDRKAAQKPCFHCGEWLNGAVKVERQIHGHVRHFCCVGCAAVCETIYTLGFENFYQTRTSHSVSLSEEPTQRNFMLFNDDELLNQLSTKDQDGNLHAELFIENINCSACIWLLESYFKKYPGVKEFQINFVSHQAHLVWDPLLTDIGKLLEAISSLGFLPKPTTTQSQIDRLESSRHLLSRVGVAGLFGAQIMMLAVALYFGQASGIETNYQLLIGGISLVLCLPIITYAAHPFFSASWHALKRGHLIMDSSVSLALILAFSASCINLLQMKVELYFDAVAMFVFFLLIARYLEARLSYQTLQSVSLLSTEIPAIAHLLRSDHSVEDVLAITLKKGDRIQIFPGEMIPVDGKIVQGCSGVDNRLMTGESTPVLSEVGDCVIGGSLNTDGELFIEVSATTRESQLQKLINAVNQSQLSVQANTGVQDKIAAGFIGLVLFLALFTAAYHLIISGKEWLPIMLSVLVVACPCALSLAWPTAQVAGQLKLLKEKILCVDLAALRQCDQLTQVIFDKTGTLTEGRYNILCCETYDDFSKDDCLQIAACLERQSAHPIAHAFKEIQCKWICDDWQAFPGSGISAVVNTEKYYLGKAEWIRNLNPAFAATILANDAVRDLTQIWLATEDTIICHFQLKDVIRADAIDTISALKAQHIHTVLLSGDNQSAVMAVAKCLELDEWHAECTPEQKQSYIKNRQRRGEYVLMCGDGANDSLALAAADISVSLKQGTSLAKISSDFILLNNQLDGLVKILSLSKKSNRTARENMIWALCYNFTLIPIAAFGLVKPWQAAIGMALSSLLVVANSARLSLRSQRVTD